MDDETKEKLVRAVLLFCALVIAGVSAYTTFMLFSVYEVDISFSPPSDAAEFHIPEERGAPKSTFDIEKEHEDSEGKTTYKDEEIEPYDNSPIMKSPLIISEDLGETGGNLAFALILLEMIIIFMIYRRLDKKIKRG
ncbi:MAG: hypothetical protein ABH864_00355 [archaeon]